VTSRDTHAGRATAAAQRPSPDARVACLAVPVARRQTHRRLPAPFRAGAADPARLSRYPVQPVPEMEPHPTWPVTPFRESARRVERIADLDRGSQRRLTLWALDGGALELLPGQVELAGGDAVVDARQGDRHPSVSASRETLALLK
jgi:hypothetical protein